MKGMQLGLDGSETLPRDPKKQPIVPLSQQANPMVVAVGEYSDPSRGGARRACGDCRFLYVKHDHGPRRYYGCRKRGPATSGPRTDHLVRWLACALFVEERRDERTRPSPFEWNRRKAEAKAEP